MLDQVARFRRFARVVTSEVGALDNSFLGRGRPLGEARLLNAVGSGRREIGQLRAYLGLDSGLVSRLLRSLEQQELITTTTDPEDGRRRIAELTPAGQEEFLAYERLSDARAESLLGALANSEQLLNAMDLCATALGRERIDIQVSDPASDEARFCLGEYYAELSRRFEGGFEVERSRDPDGTDLVAPRGAFLLATSDGLPIGCAALKGLGAGTAEVKRLWVSPVARGLGVATRLMTAVEQQAREFSFVLLRLDTNRALPEAMAMYRNAGWTEVGPFNDDPYAHFFFEKRVGAGRARRSLA